MDDLTPMPFGKYQGTIMQDVPVEYLHWLWTSGVKREKDTPLQRYIEKNLPALRQENEDLIW